jgi:hypothetical protein
MVMEVELKATLPMRQRSTRQKRRANWRLRSRVPTEEEEEVGSMGGGW